MKIVRMEFSESSPTFKVAFPFHYDSLVREMQELGVYDMPLKEDFGFNDETEWKVLVKDYWIVITLHDGSKIKVTFKKGFITDNGSVPNVGEWYIANNYLLFLFAFWVHDGMYGTKGGTYRPDRLDMKHLADDLLRAIAEFHGVDKKRVWMAFTAVDRAGAKTWNLINQRDQVQRFFIEFFPANNVEVQN